MERLPAKIAEQVVLRMKVSLSAGLVDDEFIERATALFASILLRLHATFIAEGFEDPNEALVAMASGLSLTAE